MTNNERKLSKKMLTYLVCMDIVKSAISSVGSTNSVSAMESANIISEKMINAVNKKGARK
jgi:hypothetical protein